MRLAVLERTIRDMMKKKTFLFIIFLQLFLVVALGVVLSNIGILFEPKRILHGALPMGVVGESSLYSSLRTDESLALEHFTSTQAAQGSFDAGLIDAYIYVDESAIPHVATIVLPAGDIRASIFLSVLKQHLEKHEDLLRRVISPNERALYLSSFSFSDSTDQAAASIFEIFYAVVIPFFLLLPGILLSSMMIDIVVEDIDKKTIPLVLMHISPLRYIAELAVGVIPFSLIQVLAWMLLLAKRGVIMTDTTAMIIVIVLTTTIVFLTAAVITLLFPHKTKSQLVYSFVLIFLFSSIGISQYHPLRLITSFALGVPSPSLGMVVLCYGTCAGILGLLTYKFAFRLMKS